MEHPQQARIEQYLDRTLPPEARAAFEAELAANPDLAQELRLHEITRAAVEMQALHDQRDQLYRRGRQKLRWQKIWWKTLDFLESAFLKKRADGSDHIRWSALAGVGLAAVLLLLFLVNPNLFFPEPSTPKPRAIPKEQAAVAFNTYFKRMDISSTLGSSDADTLWQAACRQYDALDCAQALPKIDHLLQRSDFDYRSRALLMKGSCLLEQNQPGDAIQAFKEVRQEAAQLYQEAKWYTALAFLKQERVEEASKILNEIAANPRNPHTGEAKAILEMGGNSQ